MFLGLLSHFSLFLFGGILSVTDKEEARRTRIARTWAPNLSFLAPTFAVHCFFFARFASFAAVRFKSAFFGVPGLLCSLRPSSCSGSCLAVEVFCLWSPPRHRTRSTLG